MRGVSQAGLLVILACAVVVTESTTPIHFSGASTMSGGDVIEPAAEEALDDAQDFGESADIVHTAHYDDRDDDAKHCEAAVHSHSKTCNPTLATDSCTGSFNEVLASCTKQKLENDETGSTKILLEAAGLPVRDPFFEAAVRQHVVAGSWNVQSLQRDIAGMSSRVLDFEQKVGALTNAIKAVPDDTTRRRLDKLETNFHTVWESVANLHPHRLGKLLTQTEVQELGDSKFEKTAEQLIVESLKKQGMLFGNLPSRSKRFLVRLQAKTRLFQAKASSALHAHRAVSLGDSNTATADRSTKLLIADLTSKWSELGLPQLHAYMVKVGKQLIDSIWAFIKKSLSVFPGAIFNQEGTVAKMLNDLSRCLDPSAASSRLKCNLERGDSRMAQMQANQIGSKTSECPNGGGDGHNWLWTEKIDTTVVPEKWTVSVPDATECAGGKCQKDSQYCDDFMNQPGFWNFNNMARKSQSPKSLMDAKQACEKNGACQGVEIPGATTGKFRCVPKLANADSSYYSFMAKWQKSLNPFGSGTDNIILAMSPGSTEKSLAKAYVRTGDLCINYEGSFPKTQVRCLSQQFYSAADKTTVAKCFIDEFKVNPLKMGKFMFDIFKDVLRMFPGGLQRLYGPFVNDMVDTLSGPALDKLLENLPFRLGLIYKLLTDQMTLWTGLNIRNLLNYREPSAIVPGNVAMRDYAIDRTQARMKRVYSPTGDACDKSAGDDCPEAISVRDATLAGERAGDYGSSGPVGSMWPGRKAFNTGTEVVQQAYVKQALCMKVPVCDTAVVTSAAHAYDASGKSKDCAGRGKCVWNAKRGNHCVCDAGYFYLAALQKCCKDGQKASECAKESTMSVETGSPSRLKESPEDKQLDAVTESDKAERSTVADLSAEVNELRVKLSEANTQKDKTSVKLVITKEKDTKVEDERSFKKSEKDDNESASKARRASEASQQDSADTVEAKAKLAEETKRSSKLNRELQLNKMKLKAMSLSNGTCTPENAAQVLRTAVESTRQALLKVQALPPLEPPATPEIPNSQSVESTNEAKTAVEERAAEQQADQEAQEAAEESEKAAQQEVDARQLKKQAVATKINAEQNKEEAAEEGNAEAVKQAARMEVDAAKEEEAAKKQEEAAQKEEDAANTEMDAARKEATSTRDQKVVEEKKRIAAEKEVNAAQAKEVLKMPEGPAKEAAQAELEEKERKVDEEAVEIDEENKDKDDEEKMAVDAEKNAEEMSKKEEKNLDAQVSNVESQEQEIAKDKEKELDDEKSKVKEEEKAVEKMPPGNEKTRRLEELEQKKEEVEASEEKAKDDLKKEEEMNEGAKKTEDEINQAEDTEKAKAEEKQREEQIKINKEQEEVDAQKQEVEEMPEGPDKDSKVEALKQKATDLKEKEVEVAKQAFAAAEKKILELPDGAEKDKKSKELAQQEAMVKQQIEGDFKRDTKIEPLPEDDHTPNKKFPEDEPDPNVEKLPPHLKKLAAENKAHKNLIKRWKASEKERKEVEGKSDNADGLPSPGALDKLQKENSETEAKTAVDKALPEPGQDLRSEKRHIEKLKEQTKLKENIVEGAALVTLLDLGESTRQPESEDALDAQQEASETPGGDEAKTAQETTDEGNDEAPQQQPDTSSEDSTTAEETTDEGNDTTQDAEEPKSEEETPAEEPKSEEETPAEEPKSEEETPAEEPKSENNNSTDKSVLAQKETSAEAIENGAPPTVESLAAKYNQGGAMYMNGISRWQDGFAGHEVVSAKCGSQKDKKACGERLGCSWSKVDGKCVDATQWHCATKKTITDCTAQRELSPMGLPVKADKLCGKLLFGQRVKDLKQCKGGIRNKHTCSADEDCPGSTCQAYKAVDGCATAIQTQCDAMGWQQLASSIA